MADILQFTNTESTDEAQARLLAFYRQYFDTRRAMLNSLQAFDAAVDEFDGVIDTLRRG